ncbi:MAG: UDP-N-acetylmuramoyl-tripeptide--D-alanyl-D-alanine ligase [Thermodesulfobacteriota bacterium]
MARNPSWTLAQVLLATGGRFLAGATGMAFTRVVSDSRAVEEGDLFVALVGENFDGHDFIEQAIAKGAAGVLVSRPPAAPHRASVILVHDTLRALGDLAHYRRKHMPVLTVLAVTGSSGKTTVKEMVSAIFEQRHNVLKTRGNFNNLIGLPLSLLPVEHFHDIAVLEMGMNRPGEIARLAEIAEPDVACITNVQGAHLEGLGTIDGVAEAKGELFAGMKAWGTLVVNADDLRVRKLARKLPHRKISFGRSSAAMVRATRVRSLGEEGMRFTLHIGSWSARMTIVSLGVHNVMNALAAAAMAHAVGMAPAEIAAGLASHRPYDKRMQISVLPSGLKLINDAYNANPSSMLAALTAVRDLKREQRIVAVLGDMLELGSHSVTAHRMIGEQVAKLGFDHLLAVGTFAGELVGEARKAGMTAKQVVHAADKEEIVAWLEAAVRQGSLRPGDLILLKGSRGMRMETIATALAATEKR